LKSAGQRYLRVRKKYKKDSFVSLAGTKNNCESSYPEPGIKIQKSIQYIYLVDIVTDNEMYYG
jgi:hypothetical protein